MKPKQKRFINNSASIELEYIPVDSAVFNRNVYAVSSLNIPEIEENNVFFNKFGEWLNAENVDFCTAKIAQERAFVVDGFIREGFDFIELSIHPYLEQIPDYKSENPLLTNFSEELMPKLEQVVGSCFVNERFHTDKHIPDSQANERYKKYIRLSYENPEHAIGIMLSEKTEIIGFTSWKISSGLATLFLIGINPSFQGKGLGKRLWKETFIRMKQQGARSVRTTVSMRNIVSVNFHSRMGFRLVDPEIVLHFHKKKYEHEK